MVHIGKTISKYW